MRLPVAEAPDASASPAAGHVVVVGAGITGLAAAHRLRADHPNITVTVLDAGGRSGGLVHTAAFDSVPLDTAADAFLSRVPDAVDLCAELGIADQLVHPAETSAFVLSHGTLRRLPAGLVLGVPTDLEALAASGIVSANGVARAADDLDGHEPLAVRDDASGDLAVGDLVRHHLGDEVFERLVAPLLGGINAGDADQLSLVAGAPQLATAIGQRSLIATLRPQLPDPGAPVAPVFAGFPTGTSTLVGALVERIGIDAVHTGTAVTTIEAQAGGTFVLQTTDDQGATDRIGADAVVMAVPAHRVAPLVAGLPGGLDDVAGGLNDLGWASVAMVALAVDTATVDHPLDASGYLVPVAERRTVTAVSFASSKWAHLARPGRALLRVSAGHAGDDSPLDMTDDELVAAITDDLGDHLGLSAPPAAHRVTRWRRALPQYRPGHTSRARSWQDTVWATHPGLWLTGASFDGLGLPACIRQGNDAARRVAAHLGA